MKKNFELKRTKINANPYYELYITMDSCDGDYISKKVKVNKKEFESNELYLLALAYISDEEYGKHINDDKDFDWISDYLADKDLMVYGIDEACHSYTGLEIELYEDGYVYKIELPDIKELFDSKEEMVKYMNDLYNEYIK